MIGWLVGLMNERNDVKLDVWIDGWIDRVGYINGCLLVGLLG